MKVDLLKKITIVDLSARLPGPFGTMILSHLGAKVIKCENTDFGGDPFNQDEIYKIAPNFKSWYKNLNIYKEVKSFSFSKNNDILTNCIELADLVVLPDTKWAHEIDIDSKPVLFLAAGKNEYKAMHDLNVLALTETFKHYEDTSPPYLPFAGIAYGQYIASFILAQLISKSCEPKTLYMKDIVVMLFDSLYHESKTKQKLLHQGLYPCYSLYESKDGKKLCLAAIEEKFWSELISSFNLELDMDDRFDLSPKTRKILQKRFANLNSDEIRKIIENKNTCLTISK